MTNLDWWNDLAEIIFKIEHLVTIYVFIVMYSPHKQYCDEGQYISHRDCQIIHSLADIDGISWNKMFLLIELYKMDYVWSKNK